MWTWRKIGTASGAVVIVVLISLVLIDQLVLPWIVSTSETVRVPAVVGKQVTTAQNLLQERGLQVKDIRYQHSPDLAPGVVMSQLPYPGATVKEGRRVYLTVSKGLETVTVPLLIGMNIRDARLALARAGLQLGAISSVTDAQIPSDAIAWQSAAAGTSIPSETAVAVGVSNGGMQKMPSLIGLRLAEARQLLDPMGVTIGSVTERNTQAFASGTIIDHQPPTDSALVSGNTVSVILAR